MARRPALRKPAPPRKARSLLAIDAGVEAQLHGACVKAGAGAALQVVLERVPLLRPFLPAQLRRAGAADSAERIQRDLIATIYESYGLTPAGWEAEGILAVAQTQSVLSPLATRTGLRSLVRGWLPDPVATPIMRYTPIEPLVTATAKAVAATWAAGRYADSVCRLRQAGADWLPAPLAEALNLAPTTLRAWSAEALALAMPPLRFAGALGRRLTQITADPPKPARKRAPATRKRVRKAQ